MDAHAGASVSLFAAAAYKAALQLFGYFPVLSLGSTSGLAIKGATAPAGHDFHLGL